jgi:thioredoxin reductase
MSVHQAMLLPDWGATTLIGIGDFLPDDAACEALARRGVVIERAPVRRVTGEATVELADGRQLAFDGLFTLTRTRMASSLPEQLGCAFDEGPVGPFVRRNETFETTVPGVFACGDAARPFGNVAVAVGDGAMVGAAAHRSLVFAS